jgi:hypothetical protein
VIFCTDARHSLGPNPRTQNANAQKIAIKVLRDVLQVPRDVWSPMAYCKHVTVIGIAKSGGGEYERVRHAVQTGVAMPRKAAEAIIQKLDSKNHGVTAVFEMKFTPYRDVEQGQEGDRPVALSFEIGFQGDESKYRCIGLSGVQLAEQQDTKITMALVPDGTYDIDKPAWQKASRQAVAQTLKECYNGVAPTILGVTATHALGVTATMQAVSQHLVQYEPPAGAALPPSLPCVVYYPSGQVSDKSHGPQRALLIPVKVRYLLDGNAIGGNFYPKGSTARPRYDRASHKEWMAQMRRMRAKARKKNGYLHMPLRVSPRLSESQKRKRTAAPRAGGPGGPGAAAMAALTEASPAEAGETSTAGETSAAGEAAAGAETETQELEDLDLSDGDGNGDGNGGAVAMDDETETL